MSKIISIRGSATALKSLTNEVDTSVGAAPTAIGMVLTSLAGHASASWQAVPAGGDVSGAGANTLNAYAQYNGTGGKTIKDSLLKSTTGASDTLTFNTTSVFHSTGSTQMFGCAGTDANNSTFINRSAVNNGTGFQNCGYGVSCLDSLTTGSTNSAYGNLSLGVATTASNSCAFGDSALASCISGISNSAFGSESSKALTTGTDNLTAGKQAGFSMLTNNDCVILGANADPSGTATANEIVIGQGATGIGANICVLGSSAITAILPGHATACDLGSASFRFDEVYTANLHNGGALALPTSADTLVGRDTIDPLTNKTMTGVSNTITSQFLKTSGADVDVSGSVPTSAGQVLTSLAGNVTASWLAPISHPLAVTTETLAYTILTSDNIVNMGNTGTVVATLPAVSNSGKQYLIINTTADDTTLTGDGAELIVNGGVEANTLTISGLNTRVQVVSNGVKWFVF